MVDVSNLEVWTCTNGKNWVAATNRAPYFCFEAESESAVLAIASRALHFYVEASARIEERRERAAAVPEYVVAKKVLAGELTRNS